MFITNNNGSKLCDCAILICSQKGKYFVVMGKRNVKLNL